MEPGDLFLERTCLVKPVPVYQGYQQSQEWLKWKWSTVWHAPFLKGFMLVGAQFHSCKTTPAATIWWVWGFWRLRKSQRSNLILLYSYCYLAWTSPFNVALALYSLPISDCACSIRNVPGTVVWRICFWVGHPVWLNDGVLARLPTCMMTTSRSVSLQYLST